MNCMSDLASVLKERGPRCWGVGRAEESEETHFYCEIEGVLKGGTMDYR